MKDNKGYLPLLDENLEQWLEEAEQRFWEEVAENSSPCHPFSTTSESPDSLVQKYSQFINRESPWAEVPSDSEKVWLDSGILERRSEIGDERAGASCRDSSFGESWSSPYTRTLALTPRTVTERLPPKLQRIKERYAKMSSAQLNQTLELMLNEHSKAQRLIEDLLDDDGDDTESK